MVFPICPYYDIHRTINQHVDIIQEDDMAEKIVQTAGRDALGEFAPAFYCGWPFAWAVFNLAKEVYQDAE